MAIISATKLGRYFESPSGGFAKKLIVLDFSWNSVANVGAEALCQFLDSQVIRLQYLDMSYNLVGDRGLYSIAEMLSRNSSL